MKLKITTLTPLVIGNDSASSLSPYADYVWQDGIIHYISTQKLESYLNREMTQKWVTKMQQSIHNSRIEYSLRDFLREQNIPLSEVTTRKLALEENPQRKVIKRFVASAGRPFIPGSSLKGAMRTAVLYAWLKETQEGQKYLQGIAAALQEQGRKNTGKEQQQLQQRLSSDALTRAIFGPPQQDPFKNVQVGDSQTLDAAALIIAKVFRFNLKTRKPDAPQWTEALPAGVELSARLRLLLNGTAASFWQRLGQWQELCRLLNAFSQASLQREIAKLSHLGFDHIRSRWDGLLQRMSRLGSGQAVLRLGQGKTIFDNSFLLLIEKDPQFFALRQALQLGKSPKTKKVTQGEFPVTRSFVAQNHTAVDALGWVLIQGE